MSILGGDSLGSASRVAIKMAIWLVGSLVCLELAPNMVVQRIVVVTAMYAHCVCNLALYC